MEKRVCRRCLIRDGFDVSFQEKLAVYRAEISEDDRTEEKEYEHRLKLCKTCPKLFQGICMACGCYVELRAAVRQNYCADVLRKWGDM